ncbi:FAD-binding oxidoreductase [Streptomyces ipomoeae]|uniref:Tat pathway signal sequence domain protein n=2 Tax=Streptomyces ipomoeae TaxID=103232 RepID=L1KSH5_9ACTN|nr:FAD-binding protein [Streptomyces ipomoeae]EKX63308.1 Tat pathway signal sequence domain protein [Streptomyces ipomoeae 91-03]MDX2699604.1 FAD-binding protein [Streptomyces ipomoeae]MDX2825859.1 FAD-binding protein [Streptomyces ipomoeae]MDX2844547.1 FAD-binding protein [Streptomyces ipomoeae]MDX2877728.1 FAD-binding protein [Streptomyces ipomoeae]
MTEHDRRTVLRAAAAGAAAAGITAGPLRATPAHARTTETAATTAETVVATTGALADGTRPGLVLRPDDPRYEALAGRGYNRRFTGRPLRIHLPTTTAQVVDAVQEAVRRREHVVARSGGHCFEDFVDNDGVRVVVDLSRMTAVRYDDARDAFMVEAGSRLGEAYRALYVNWGVTLPAGWCPEVGIGGHVPGGGYGTLCRLHGLSVDRLYAVEVVVVDRSGRARAVLATREENDPNRDLWWAHTGGGGGSFGIVTRFWFRDLPEPPVSVLTFRAEWSWEGLDRTTFTRLVGNYGTWVERNSVPGAHATRLYSEFILSRKLTGRLFLVGQVADTGPAADRLLHDHLAAIGHGIDAQPFTQTHRLSWLTAASVIGSPDDPGPLYRIAIKSAYAHQGLAVPQIHAVHHHLTRTDYDYPAGLVSLNTYGGRVNSVPADATAVAHRDSVLKIMFLTGWEKAAEDERHRSFLRELYRDVYADTGGVPARTGAFINYPDADLADPRHNTSTTAWHTLYHGTNYPALQRAKGRWDPRDIFHHRLSVRPGKP